MLTHIRLVNDIFIHQLLHYKVSYLSRHEDELKLRDIVFKRFFYEIFTLLSDKSDIYRSVNFITIDPICWKTHTIQLVNCIPWIDEDTGNNDWMNEEKRREEKEEIKKMKTKICFNRRDACDDDVCDESQGHVEILRQYKQLVLLI